MKKKKKSLLAMLIILTALVVMPQMQNKVEAATIKISKTKKTIYEGNKYTLKVTGTTKKVKWRSLDKKIAKVNSNGKVTAKKNGKTTIIAKVGKKELKCTIKVKLPQYDEKFYYINDYASKRIKLNKTTKTTTIKTDLDGDNKKDLIKIKLVNNDYLKTHKITVNGKLLIEGAYTELYIVDVNKKDKYKEIVIKDAEATDGPGFGIYRKYGKKIKDLGGIGVADDLRFNGKGKILSDGDQLNYSPRVFTKYYTINNKRIKENIASAKKIKDIVFKSEYIQLIKDPNVIKDVYTQDFSETFINYNYIDENGNEVEDAETNTANKERLNSWGVQELNNIEFNITKFGKTGDYDTIKIKGINQNVEGYALHYFAI